MPSAKEVFLARGFVGLAQDGSPFKGVGMAQDAMPKAFIADAAGGGKGARDQDPDDNNVTVVETPTAATFARLHKLLAANLSPDDLSSAEELIQQLFTDTDPSGSGVGMAGDRGPTYGYSQYFPNADRLGKQGLTGVTSSTMASDSRGSSDYSKRFPNAGRLVRTF